MMRKWPQFKVANFGEVVQDVLDVLQLLYWRLGFETREILEEMQKNNSLMFV